MHAQQYRLILLFHFNLKFGDMGISKKGRLKYSGSDSVFVYLAEKGGSLDNFKNLIFSPISRTLYQPGKNSRKRHKIFLHTCVEDRLAQLTKKKLISYLKPFGLFRAIYHKVA